MLGYIIRRTLQSIFFIFLSILVAYTVMVVLMPNGPAKQYGNLKQGFQQMPNGTFMELPEVTRQRAYLEEYYEVDKPWPFNYLGWLFDPSETSEVDPYNNMVPKGIDIAIGDWHLRGSGALTGDFNRSGDITRRGEQVTALIGRMWGPSVLLLVMTLLFAIVISIPLGMIVAAKPNSRLDHAVTFLSTLGLSIPAFGLGLLLIVAFAILPRQWNAQFGWSWIPYFPAGSPYDLYQEHNIFNRIYHAFLPAITLAIPQIAVFTKHVRASMLEVMGLDYIRTARAKGLPTWRVLSRHAFRNALLPIITVVGLALPGIISGAIIVEYVFAYQGMGQLMFTALGGCVPTEERPCPPGGYGITDLSTAMALTLLLFTIIALSNMLADVMTALADPRVEYGGRTKT